LVTETWEERPVNAPAGRVVPGGRWNFATLLSNDQGAKARDNVWRHLSEVRAYVDHSTETMRAATLSVLDLVLAAAPQGTFSERDTHPRLQGGGLTVEIQAEGKSQGFQVAISRDQPFLSLANLTFDPDRQTLSISGGPKGTKLVEVRHGPGKRAALQRETISIRARARSSRAQRDFDAAFTPPPPPPSPAAAPR
jgi:hypothetical protein